MNNSDINPSTVLRTHAQQAWSGTRERLARFVFLASVAVAAVFAVQVPAGASSVDTPAAAEGSAVAAAESLVAGEDGNDYFDRELVADLGYRPAVENSRAVNSSGDCSSPVPLPASFESACRTHDLGYDLLRVADKRGEPIPASLRPAMDRQLAGLMKESCADGKARGDAPQRHGCRAVGNIAWSGVAVNTIRQSNGAPVEERWLPR